MPQAMKLGVLAAATALWVLLGMAVSPASDAGSLTRQLNERLRAHVSSAGKRVEMPLVAFTGSYTIRRSSAGARETPPPKRTPRIDLRSGVAFGVQAVPRAARVEATLLDVRKRRTKIVDESEMSRVGDSGRRWRAAFERTRGGDFVVFDVSYPRARRPHVTHGRGRVNAATFAARTSDRSR